MRTTRIVNSVTRTAALQNTSTATIFSTLLAPLSIRQAQQSSAISNVKSDIDTLKLTTINTDVSELENRNPKIAETIATKLPAKQSSHSPTRITNHDKFRLDFRTLDQRIAEAELHEPTPSRSIQLRS